MSKKIKPDSGDLYIVPILVFHLTRKKKTLKLYCLRSKNYG